MTTWVRLLNRFVLIIISGLLVTGCQISSPNGSTKDKAVSHAVHSGKVEVDLKNMAFTPNVIYVTKGTTVTWKN
ncbi:MAG TPA: hypothetical protein VFH42_03790, partial [Sporolactobacillaceae bacterium]|nr:hypothetical protein [Sporolactobacillaceae bacterium]